MESSVVASERELREWLNSGLDAAARDAEAMLAGPRHTWSSWIDAHPAALTYHFANTLLDLSVEARDRDPAEALALTRMLVDRLPRLDVPMPDAGRLLRVRIWLEHGNALLIADDLPAALAAYQEALRITGDGPALPLLAAMARRGAAWIHHRQGDAGEPLRTIRADIALFEAHHALGDVLRSRIIEAGILYDHGRFREARDIFVEADAIARRMSDERMLARIANNLGHCERQLGHSREAVQHLVEARHLFQKHGMTGERFRSDWGIELLRGDEGAATDAVSALRALMQPLIESGRAVEAALVALDVVELLVLSERQDHVHRVASELVSVFEHARMPREALRALAALRAVAEERRVAAEDVRRAVAHVRAVAG